MASATVTEATGETSVKQTDNLQTTFLIILVEINFKYMYFDQNSLYFVRHGL